MKTTENIFVAQSSAERIREYQEQNWCQDKKLTIHEYADALLYPGNSTATAGLYVDRNLIPSTRLNGYLQVPTSLQFDGEAPAEILDEPVIYIGVLYDCWGHCITDEMKFLWVFLNEQELLPPRFQGAKCVYAACLKGHPMPKNFKALLAALGIPESRLVPISNPTKLQSCCVPDECFWVNEDHTARFYTREYAALAELICTRVSKPLNNPPRKVYFSRTAWHKWEFGEIYIERAFAQAGYQIVHPEKLSFDEMVSLLQHVDCMAATQGSCAHNSLFMRSEAELILIRKHDYYNLYQFAINQVRHLKCTYIDSNLSLIFWNKREPNVGPFFMYCSRNLVKFLGQGKLYFPVFTFIHYLCFCIFLKGVRFASPSWNWVKRQLGIPEFQLLKWL